MDENQIYKTLELMAKDENEYRAAQILRNFLERIRDLEQYKQDRKPEPFIEDNADDPRIETIYENAEKKAAIEKALVGINKEPLREQLNFLKSVVVMQKTEFDEAVKRSTIEKREAMKLVLKGKLQTLIGEIDGGLYDR